MGKNLEEILGRKASEFLSSSRGLRKPDTEDIFERKLYVFPKDIRLVNYWKKPLASFNPGAVLVDREVWVFPRLIFDYYGYSSSIGFFKVGVEDLLEGRVGKPISARIVLWPRFLWEFKGCEDARIHPLGENFLMLYTGYGYRGGKVGVVQGLTTISRRLEVGERKFFVIGSNGEEFVPRSMKDSAFIKVSGNYAAMLIRPTIDGVDVAWRGEADLSKPAILGGTMEPVLGNEEWEYKVGWSTNTIRLSSNEYLVGWHGVLREDFSYRNGLAIVDREGELLAISNYLLAPNGLIEEYGDRPLVIFGDGLVLYKEELIWVGGISDCVIGFFTVELEKALEKLRWVKG